MLILSRSTHSKRSRRCPYTFYRPACPKRPRRCPSSSSPSLFARPVRGSSMHATRSSLQIVSDALPARICRAISPRFFRCSPRSRRMRCALSWPPLRTPALLEGGDRRAVRSSPPLRPSDHVCFSAYLSTLLSPSFPSAPRRKTPKSAEAPNRSTSPSPGPTPSPFANFFFVLSSL